MQGMVEGADAAGVRDERLLQGDVAVVRARRALAVEASRVRAAVQHELDKLTPRRHSAPVPAAELRAEREAAEARGGIVDKTAAKIATDERTWLLYVEEQRLNLGDYPSKEQVVEFAVWMTRHRERACLAQRVEAEQELTGKVKRV
jgi:hypothetical protein